MIAVQIKIPYPGKTLPRPTHFYSGKHDGKHQRVLFLVLTFPFSSFSHHFQSKILVICIISLSIKDLF